MTEPFALPDQWQLLHWKTQVNLAEDALAALGKEPVKDIDASRARAILSNFEKQAATTSRAEMAKPKAEPVVPEGEQSVQIRLLRDTWQGEERIRADGKVTVWPLADARRLIDAKVAERADPLPGEHA